MKILLSFLLITLTLLSLTACNSTPSDYDDEKLESSAPIIKTEDISKSEISEEISVGLLKKSPTTNESHFEVVSVPGGVSIDKYIGDDSIVVIPETINGKSVVAVERRAFMDNDNIKGVRLADSIKILGDEAFNMCDNLEVFICGSNLEVIGETCLFSCPKLSEIVLNEGLKTIEMAAIFAEECMSEIYIPSSVININGGISTQSDLTIICEKGSVAEQYAIEEGINYKYK